METIALGTKLQVKIHHCDDVIETGARDSRAISHLHSRAERMGACMFSSQLAFSILKKSRAKTGKWCHPFFGVDFLH